MKIMMNLLPGNRIRCTALALSVFAASGTAMWSQSAQENTPPPAQQDGPHGHPSREERQAHELSHLQKQLNLTYDQTAQIKTIFSDTDTQMKALHENTSVAPADKRAQMKSIHEATNAKIRAVLTSQQQPKFDAMLAHEQERWQHRGAGAPEQGAQNQAPPPAS